MPSALLFLWGFDSTWQGTSLCCAKEQCFIDAETCLLAKRGLLLKEHVHLDRSVSTRCVRPGHPAPGEGCSGVTSTLTAQVGGVAGAPLRAACLHSKDSWDTHRFYTQLCSSNCRSCQGAWDFLQAGSTVSDCVSPWDSRNQSVPHSINTANMIETRFPTLCGPGTGSLENRPGWPVITLVTQNPWPALSAWWSTHSSAVSQLLSQHSRGSPRAPRPAQASKMLQSIAAGHRQPFGSSGPWSLCQRIFPGGSRWGTGDTQKPHHGSRLLHNRTVAAAMRRRLQRSPRDTTTERGRTMWSNRK